MTLIHPPEWDVVNGRFLVPGWRQLEERHMKQKIEITVGNWKQTDYRTACVSTMPAAEARKAAKGGYTSLEKWARKRGFPMKTARWLADL